MWASLDTGQGLLMEVALFQQRLLLNGTCPSDSIRCAGISGH